MQEEMTIKASEHSVALQELTALQEKHTQSEELLEKTTAQLKSLTASHEGVLARFALHVIAVIQVVFLCCLCTPLTRVFANAIMSKQRMLRRLRHLQCK